MVSECVHLRFVYLAQNMLYFRDNSAQRAHHGLSFRCGSSAVANARAAATGSAAPVIADPTTTIRVGSRSRSAGISLRPMPPAIATLRSAAQLGILETIGTASAPPASCTSLLT